MIFYNLKKHFKLLGWHDLDIETLDWEYHRKSHGGRPLIFSTFGKGSGQIVLFLGAVHGDESPSVYVLFRFAQFLKKNHQLYTDKTIVIAPLVNPDGFFSRPQRRMNGRGVDVNRNFPTKDWKRSKKDRYYSGPHANSESETRFQIALINRFRPTHIISVHSPLGCYDYDGPSSNFDEIVTWMKKLSRENGLPFRRYQIFPGSLGNYAGMERKIHTLTLELPSSAPQKGAEYFDQFKSMFLEILALNP
jgi:protein MpaA